MTKSNKELPKKVSELEKMASDLREEITQNNQPKKRKIRQTMDNPTKRASVIIDLTECE